MNVLTLTPTVNNVNKQNRARGIMREVNFVGGPIKTSYKVEVMKWKGKSKYALKCVVRFGKHLSLSILYSLKITKLNSESTSLYEVHYSNWLAN